MENVNEASEPKGTNLSVEIDRNEILTNPEAVTLPILDEPKKELERGEEVKPDKKTEGFESVQKGRITRVVNEFKSDANNILDEIKKSNAEMAKTVVESNGLKQKIEEICTALEEKSKNIDEKYTKIQELYKELFTSGEEEMSMEEGFREMNSEMEEALKAIKDKKKELEEFHTKIFGSKNEDGVQDIVGLKQEIENRKKSLDELYQQKQKEFKTLFAKIEGLLPGATSTGLAKAYQDQKGNYRWPSIIWSCIFVGTMISMAVFGFFTWKDVAQLQTLTFSAVASKLLARSPFFIATIWLGYFASKQQSQNKRLEQEYAHKECASRSYEGFKKQIESLEQTEEDKKLTLKLLGNLVDSVGYNPSITLDNESHREEPPLLNRLVSNFVGSRKKENGENKE